MASDLGNMLRMMNVLGDEGFIDALESAENLVDDADETLERVEKIEGDAAQAVEEANETMTAVDNRLSKFDETISLLEAKIEAGFSIGFFFFGLNRYLEGDLLLAAALFGMGLLGGSSLVVTIVTLPQVRRLRQFGLTAWRHVDDEDDDEQSPENTAADEPDVETDGGRTIASRDSSSDTDVTAPHKRRAGRYGCRRE